jgi:hypothetical protein
MQVTVLSKLPATSCMTKNRKHGRMVLKIQLLRNKTGKFKIQNGDGSSRFWRVMALPAWHNDGWEAEPPDLHRLLEDERIVSADLLQRTRCTPGAIHHIGLNLAKENIGLNSPNLLALEKKQYKPLRMKFILCRRCFTVKNPGTRYVKSAKTDQAKNPQDICSSLAAKRA